MDNLNEILDNLSFSADMFFSGNMCGIQTLGGADTNKGHLHRLKSGVLTLVCEDGLKVVLDKPSVLFMPGPSKHQIVVSESNEAELVCVDIEFFAGSGAPLINTLPKLIHFDISQNNDIGKTANWLFNEAKNKQSGSHVIIDRLCDIFLVQILRHVLEEGLVIQGMLAALSHPRLAGLMTELHKRPDVQWSVESMAEKTNMSRAKFAALFKATVGQAPNDYLTDLRVAVAQGLLKKDKSVGYIANKVGYEHGSALARVFRKKTGFSPKEWLLQFKK